MREATVAELKDRAKAMGIHGYGSMNKAQLLAALEKPIESAKDSGPEVEKPAEAKKSSDSDIDYAKHPKFHKFKGTGKKEQSK